MNTLYWYMFTVWVIGFFASVGTIIYALKIDTPTDTFKLNNRGYNAYVYTAIFGLSAIWFITWFLMLIMHANDAKK